MKNKKALFVLTAFTAAVIVSAKIISKSRKEDYSSKDIFVFGDEETIKQAEEYSKAIFEVLNDEYLCCFDDFAIALSEYYGITAKCYDGKTVEYSSDKYPALLTSENVIRKSDNTEIQLESMDDLEDCFLGSEDNYRIYYGEQPYTRKAVMLNRRNFSLPPNRLICGASGSGKTSLIKQEIRSVLSQTNDRIFVITADGSYNDISADYEQVQFVEAESGDFCFNVPDNKRIIVCSLEKLSRKKGKHRLSQSALSENYCRCLEAVWQTICSGADSGRVSWLFIDDIRDIAYSEHGKDLLYDILVSARPKGSIITLSTQSFYTLTDDVGNYHFLHLITFFTLLNLNERDREIIRKYYGEYLSEYDMQFTDKYDKHSEKNNYRKGLHVVDSGLTGNSSKNFQTLPFYI